MNAMRERDYAIAFALAEAGAELRRAMMLHKPMNSAHEAYSVILEELDEFWDEVKKKRESRSRENMRKELTQIAAMALRALVELRFDEQDSPQDVGQDGGDRTTPRGTAAAAGK